MGVSILAPGKACDAGGAVEYLMFAEKNTVKGTILFNDQTQPGPDAQPFHRLRIQAARLFYRPGCPLRVWLPKQEGNEVAITHPLGGLFR